MGNDFIIALLKSICIWTIVRFSFEFLTVNKACFVTALEIRSVTSGSVERQCQKTLHNLSQVTKITDAKFLNVHLYSTSIWEQVILT